MAIELKVPTVGESISEVQIGEWLKKEGETIKVDETLAMIDTEKTTVELPAPISGVLLKILKQSGEIALVGEVIAHLEDGTSAKSASQSTADASQSTAQAPPSDSPAPEWENSGAKVSASGAVAESGEAIESQNATAQNATAPNGAANVQAEPSNQDKFIMPAAQRALDQNDVRAADVSASGPGGRLLKEDVTSHIAGKSAVQSTAAPAQSTADAVPAPKAPPAVLPAPAAPVVAGEDEEIVPMTMLRRRVAEHLVHAQQEAALLTTFNEIDMSAVMDLRKQHQDAFTKKYGIKLGFMSFFVKAAIDALKQFPGINAEIRGTDIVYRNHYDIGVAIGGGKGLVVPVLRRAERMSFAEIEGGIAQYAARAKENTLKPDELMGGTFTITNGGVYGSLLSTPIVNAPQSGILGMHTIQERPVARNGQVVIAPMMYVALTYDHRVVDGREAVSFLVRLKECIENPSRMLIEA